MCWRRAEKSNLIHDADASLSKRAQAQPGSLSILVPRGRVELPAATFVASRPVPPDGVLAPQGLSRTAATRYRKPGAGSAGKGLIGRSGIEPASGEI